MKESKLFKIARNGDKIGQKQFFDCWPPAPQSIYFQTYYIIPQPAACEIMTWWRKVFT